MASPAAWRCPAPSRSWILAVTGCPGPLEVFLVGREGKQQAHLGGEGGEEFIEQRAAQQADDVLMEMQAVGAEGAPVFPRLRQLGDRKSVV